MNEVFPISPQLWIDKTKNQQFKGDIEEKAREFTKIFVKTMLKPYGQNIFQESESSQHMENLVIPILADKIVGSDFPLFQKIHKTMLQRADND